MNKQHQVKAKWYYIFWGAMAVAVVGGYRKMAEATKSTAITVSCIVPYETPVKQVSNKTSEFE